MTGSAAVSKDGLQYRFVITGARPNATEAIGAYRKPLRRLPFATGTGSGLAVTMRRRDAKTRGGRLRVRAPPSGDLSSTGTAAPSWSSTTGPSLSQAPA